MPFWLTFVFLILIQPGFKILAGPSLHVPDFPLAFSHNLYCSGEFFKQLTSTSSYPFINVVSTSQNVIASHSYYYKFPNMYWMSARSFESTDSDVPFFRCGEHNDYYGDGLRLSNILSRWNTALHHHLQHGLCH